MKLSEYKSGSSAIVKQVNLTTEYQQRLVPIGIYNGAHIHVERQGTLHYPFLLFVCGNFIMMRVVDVSQIEMEE